MYVSWHVLGNVNPSQDVSPTNDVLVFDAFEREKTFTIQAVADTIPELERSFHIQLNVTQVGMGR